MSSISSTQDHIFNQYFFDLLKKIKGVAKTIKHDSHDARTILRSVKKNYQNNDSLSPSFRAFANSSEAAPVWDAYTTCGDEDADLLCWFDSNAEAECIMKDVPLMAIKSVYSDAHVLHHYLTILNIFRTDIAENVLVQTVEVLKNVGKNGIGELIEKVEDEGIRNKLTRIVALYTRRSAKQGPNMSELENTSLGRLAKEILSEVNVEELQTSLGNGDIMQALANPDGGLVKLLGTVSQKMISKMSTGELKQENLLQDAMKLATQLGGPDLGALGNLANMFTGAGDDSGSFDFANLAKMMGGMGGGNNKTRARPNTANIKRMAKVRDMRQKLDERRQSKKATKENVSVHVEEEQ